MSKEEGIADRPLRGRQLWLTAGWALVAVVVLMSLWPAPIVDAGEGQSDKALHVFAYAVLMSWFASIHGEHDRRRRFAVGFVAMGITLELVQPLTGLRQFEWIDFVANTAGVLLGWVLAPPRLPNVLLSIEQAFGNGKPSNCLIQNLSETDSLPHVKI